MTNDPIQAVDAQLRRGRRWLRAIGIAFVVVAVSDLAACWADGAKLFWGRFFISMAMAWHLADGGRWARWIAIALVFVAALLFALSVKADLVGSWRHLHLWVSTPILVVAALALLFHPAVRTYFRITAPVAAKKS